MVPRFAVSSQYGPCLEQSLVPVARALSLFDRALIKRVRALERRVAFNTDNTQGADLRDIDKQFEDIYSTKYGFNKLYLKNERFIAIWEIGLRHVRRVLESKESNGNHAKQRDDFESILLSYRILAFNLKDAVIDAAVEGVLEQKVLYLIRDRWTRLDEVLDWYHEHTDTSRTIPTWLVKTLVLDRLTGLQYQA